MSPIVNIWIVTHLTVLSFRGPPSTRNCLVFQIFEYLSISSVKAV